MDMLSNIEYQMAEVLKKIQIGQQAPSGYPYYNTVSIVNETDEASAIEYGKYPMVSIYLEPSENNNTEYTNAYLNVVQFKLDCKVALIDEVPNPRFAINEKMNTLLSDIKAVFGNYKTLNCSCDMSTILRSNRKYNIKNDLFRVGQLEVYIEVKYTQQLNNPNKRCIV